MLSELLLTSCECIWNCAMYLTKSSLTASAVWALWLGFTVAKTKHGGWGGKCRRSFGVQIILATGQEVPLSGTPQAVMQRACTSRLEIRKEHRVLPVQIWNWRGQFQWPEPPLAPAPSCGRGSARTASERGRRPLCKFSPLPPAFLQYVNTFGAPAGPSTCTDFYTVWTIKHLDNQTVPSGKLDLVCYVLAWVTDLEVFLHWAFFSLQYF